MSAAQRILVIGGGFSGMSAAIQLRKVGCDVDLVEIDPDWRCYGAGISLGPPTLRALQQMGLLERYLELGHASDNLELYAPNGQPIGIVPTHRLVGPEVPAHGAIMRPVLARILAEETKRLGTKVRLGCTFKSIEPRADQVEVACTDGTRGSYDLVIGADGLFSAVRGAVFPGSVQPRYFGQAVWRAVLPRPEKVKTAMMWLGAEIKPGVCPVSRSELYMYITESRPSKDRLEESALPGTMRALLKDFTDPLIIGLRDSITARSSVTFRPLEGMLMPRPWYKGRVVLIGDAVHATTPHMASGACIGIEDAIVLAEECARSASVAAALEAFEKRRYDRCRTVVENSGRLGQIEMEHGDMKEHARIMRETTVALEAPI